MKSWILAAASALLLAAGCSGRLERPNPPHNPGALYDDLPTPPHFEYHTNQSNQSPTGAWRVVNQTLKGKNQRVGDAAKFYQEILPKNGWTLEKHEGDPKASVKMSFTNKEERCTIDIRDESPTVVLVTLKVDKKS